MPIWEALEERNIYGDYEDGEGALNLSDNSDYEIAGENYYSFLSDLYAVN